MNSINSHDIKVGTIRRIHHRLTEEGYQISENALRQWIRCGQIPATYSGNTAYISYEKVIKFLTSQSGLTA